MKLISFIKNPLGYLMCLICFRLNSNIQYRVLFIALQLLLSKDTSILHTLLLPCHLSVLVRNSSRNL